MSRQYNVPDVPIVPIVYTGTIGTNGTTYSYGYRSVDFRARLCSNLPRALLHWSLIHG